MGASYAYGRFGAPLSTDPARQSFTHPDAGETAYQNGTDADAANVETATSQTLDNDGDGGIIKERVSLPFDLQFFAEQDIKNQESSSLMKGIKSYRKRINEHQMKIARPQDYIRNWNEFDPRYQEGLRKHWEREIENFNQSILTRVEELKRRGDFNE